MTRKDYTHVRLEMPVYNTLKEFASKDKKSISGYIGKLLSEMLTSVKIQNQNQLQEVAQRPKAPVLKTGCATHSGSSNLPLGALRLVQIRLLSPCIRAV